MAATERERDYLTPGEVAQLLHVSPRTVNRWAREGKLTCVLTLGGHRRFPKAEVLAIVEDQAKPE